VQQPLEKLGRMKFYKGIQYVLDLWNVISLTKASG